MNFDKVAWTIIKLACNAQLFSQDALDYAQEYQLSKASLCLDTARVELNMALHLYGETVCKEFLAKQLESSSTMDYARACLMKAMLTKDTAEQMMPMYRMQNSLLEKCDDCKHGFM